MNWNRIEGNWKEIKGNVQEQWGRLNDDEMVMMSGRRAHLAGKIQKIHGANQDESDKRHVDAKKRQQRVGHQKHVID